MQRCQCRVYTFHIVKSVDATPYVRPEQEIREHFVNEFVATVGFVDDQLRAPWDRLLIRGDGRDDGATWLSSSGPEERGMP